MAMYLGECPVYTIMLIGRWSSDTFLQYIRKQVMEFSHNVSKRMLKFQNYCHIPNFEHHIPQMTHEYAMIRTTPRRDEMLVVIRHDEHRSHHSRNSVNPWNRQKLHGKLSQTEHQAQPTKKPT